MLFEFLISEHVTYMDTANYHDGMRMWGKLVKNIERHLVTDLHQVAYLFPVQL